MLDHARNPHAATLSARSVELLLDLVEIRLAAMDIEDRDELAISHLKYCRDELKTVLGTAAQAQRRGRGRPTLRPETVSAAL